MMMDELFHATMILVSIGLGCWVLIALVGWYILRRQLYFPRLVWIRQVVMASSRRADRSEEYYELVSYDLSTLKAFKATFVGASKGFSRRKVEWSEGAFTDTFRYFPSGEHVSKLMGRNLPRQNYIAVSKFGRSTLEIPTHANQDGVGRYVRVYDHEKGEWETMPFIALAAGYYLWTDTRGQ